MEEKRWCYYCGETKPLTPEYWAGRIKNTPNTEPSVESALTMTA